MSSGIPQVRKDPAEVYSVGWRYSAETLPAGALLSSGVVAAVDLEDESDVSGTILPSTTATISGGGLEVTAKVQAGTDGRNYRVTFTTTLDNGDVFVDTLILKVRVAGK